MKIYWKNCWSFFRKAKPLTNHPAWSAINLAAIEGTSWERAELAFRALLIASDTNEQWQRNE